MYSYDRGRTYSNKSKKMQSAYATTQHTQQHPLQHARQTTLQLTKLQHTHKQTTHPRFRVTQVRDEQLALRLSRSESRLKVRQSADSTSLFTGLVYRFLCKVSCIGLFADIPLLK